MTQFCGHQHRPEWARACVSDMAGHSGLDVLFAMIDGGRSGVSQACREHGVAQIGNVLNWVERDPQVFVASAICDSGAALFRAIEDHAHGLLPLGGYRSLDWRSLSWCGWRWALAWTRQAVHWSRPGPSACSAASMKSTWNMVGRSSRCR